MISRSKTDPLQFSSGDVLSIADHTTKLGFVGAALSRLQIADSGDSAMSYFLTGTYYHDFSDDMRSTYSILNDPTPHSLETSVLGNFGEVSLGSTI